MTDQRDGVTRRRFLGTSLGIGAAGAIACVSAGSEQAPNRDPEQTQGRLHARVHAPKPQTQTFSPGEQPLGLSGGKERDGLLYIPHDLSAEKPAPLILLLHGARGGAKGVTARVDAYKLADQFKCIILAPDSRIGTWDVIREGSFGPDVAFIDTSLAWLFDRIAIDPARLAVGGFSDGASYALSLGLINGDLFTHILAFSPGFFVAKQTHGRPSIFDSHGTNDEILPIDTTSHRLVPALRDAGYPVQFRVFAGPHTVPPDIAREAFEWMFGAKPR